MSRTTPCRLRREGIPVTNAIQHAHALFWNWLWDATERAVDAWINRPRIGDTRPGTGPVVFKPRDHFNADGTPKRKWGQATAELKAVELGCKAYRCTICNAWHVGHRPTARAA